MPAKSKSQQKFMGMVHALQKGDLDPSDVSKDVEDAAKSMTKKDAKDFASTKHKGLPNRVKEMKIDEGIKIDNYDIGYGSLGNGLIVWDAAAEEHGDYKKLAHISDTSKKITWYDKKLTPKVKAYIKKIAINYAKEKIGENMKPKSMKLKDAMNYEINEDIFASLTDPDSGLDEEQKKAFLEAVGGFNRFNESVYREKALKEVTADIVKIGKLAEKYVMAEQDDWFDGISVKRDMKSLQDSIKMFESTAKEVSILQQRLESVYEEVGGKIGKYFEINDDVIKEDEESITLSDIVHKQRKNELKTSQLKPGMMVMHSNWDPRSHEPMKVVKVKGKIMLNDPSSGKDMDPHSKVGSNDSWYEAK